MVISNRDSADEIKRWPDYGYIFKVQPIAVMDVKCDTIKTHGWVLGLGSKIICTR